MPEPATKAQPLGGAATPVRTRANRLCRGCKRTLPTEGFPRDATKASGHGSMCKDCKRDRAGDRREYFRTYHLAERGMTAETYDELLNAQDGVCAICREPETLVRRGRVERLTVDHDHETDVVRGLLCHRCNTAVGLLRDDPDLLRAAILYLAGTRG